MSEQQGEYKTVTDRLNADGNRVMRALSGMMLWLRYDDDSGGIVSTDQGGYVLTRKEFDEVTDGIRKFFEYYGDGIAEKINAEIDEGRAARRAEEAKKKKPKAAPVVGHVYLIRAENGLYKIGKAKSVSSRLQPFAVSFPMKWELVYSFRSDDYTFAEAYLHERFADKRDVGEWFRLSPADVEAITDFQDGQL